MFSFPLQPGKLTEAFKYFLQGMGYSKYTPTTPGKGLEHITRALGCPWVRVFFVTRFSRQPLHTL